MLITFKLASLLLLPLMYTPTIQQLVNMTLPPPPPSVAACLRESEAGELMKRTDTQDLILYELVRLYMARLR